MQIQSFLTMPVVKQKLRSILRLKYELKDQEVFDKAYSYIEIYY